MWKHRQHICLRPAVTAGTQLYGKLGEIQRQLGLDTWDHKLTGPGYLCLRSRYKVAKMHQQSLIPSFGCLCA